MSASTNQSMDNKSEDGFTHTLSYNGLKNFNRSVEDTPDLIDGCQLGVDLNQIFNDLPIRIIGSHQFPMFYASDIGKILGIGNVRDKIRGFSQKEIVNYETRQKMGISTHRANGSKHDGITLLTEYGVYRLMFTQNSELAESFREWFYDMMHKVRTTGEYHVQLAKDKTIQKLKTRNEEHMKILGTLKLENQKVLSKLNQFRNLTDKLWLFELKNDHRKIQLSKQIPHHDQFEVEDDDYSLSDDDCDTIDDWDAYSKDFPKDATDRLYSYKLTLNPTASDHSNYQCLRALYVRDGYSALESINKKLSNCIIGKHVYSCNKQQIIDLVDGVELTY